MGQDVGRHHQVEPGPGEMMEPAGHLRGPGLLEPGDALAVADEVLGAHGIEATGQRLIFMLGQLLAFVVALLPAAAFFIGFFFILRIFLTVSLVIPLASLVAALILGLEAAFGLMLLGWLFERFDLSAEPAAQEGTSLIPLRL